MYGIVSSSMVCFKNFDKFSPSRPERDLRQGEEAGEGRDTGLSQGFVTLLRIARPSGEEGCRSG